MLRTANEVIDALGGTTPMARLTGRKLQHVSNWRAAGRLPADTFLIVNRALGDINETAHPSVWGIKEPAEREAS